MALLPRSDAEHRAHELSHWTLEANAISRRYELASFPQAVQFVSRLVPGAEAANHHPDITISFRRVTLRYTTHSQGGLTARDFAGARMADEVFASLNE